MITACLAFSYVIPVYKVVLIIIIVIIIIILSALVFVPIELHFASHKTDDKILSRHVPTFLLKMEPVNDSMNSDIG